MIFVLPILLYPILGIGIVSLTAAMMEEARSVILLGAEHLPPEPPLLNADRDGFDPSLFDAPTEADKLKVVLEGPGSVWNHPVARRVGLKQGHAYAVVMIPPGVRDQLAGDRAAKIPVAYDSASERSQVAYLRVREVLTNWKDRIVSRRLEKDRKPASYTEPVQTRVEDVATRAESGGSVWAKLFPFLLVMMALTGAFYPAVDLCAGEKERGTMETLLISPASRTEIVMGKFLTVMLASAATALLNLLSMGLTGWRLAHQIGQMGGRAGGPERRAAVASIITAPSLASAVWMVLLLIPLSAFFSAVCLALAVLARSMKEGQYYMTPLYLVAMPLVFLTLAPGIELNLFYSLIPITGVSLLLRSLMLGEYGVAGRYMLPVLLPTLVYGACALRWAIDQFQREGVLFREAERFDVRGWVRHLFRDKEPIPTAGEALFCFVLMLSSAWFVSISGLLGSSPAAMAAGQVAFILTPPVAMGLLLTSRPRRTLRLRWPGMRYLALGVGLALTLSPLINELGRVVEHLFPISERVKGSLAELMKQIPNGWTALLLLAVVPAICEEVAFRGYILSGLERTYRPSTAIVLSALLFGFLHVLLSLFQQFFGASLLGVILGLLAVRSGSLLPGIAFHLVHNGLVVAAGLTGEGPGGRLAAWLYRDAKQGLYHWPLVALGAVASAALLAIVVRGDGRGRAGGVRELVPDEALTP